MELRVESLAGPSELSGDHGNDGRRESIACSRHPSPLVGTARARRTRGASGEPHGHISLTSGEWPENPGAPLSVDPSGQLASPEHCDAAWSLKLGGVDPHGALDPTLDLPEVSRRGGLEVDEAPLIVGAEGQPPELGLELKRLSRRERPEECPEALVCGMPFEERPKRRPSWLQGLGESDGGPERGPTL